MELTVFDRQMSDRGWVMFPEFVPLSLIAKLKIDLEFAYSECSRIQQENFIEGSEGAGHHVVMYGNSFLEYISLFEDLNVYAQCFFNGKYILNTFGGNILKSGMSYASHIHRDIRSHSGSLPLMMNTIVMLDDFTMDNGATWLMHRGHIHSDKPDEDDFNKQAFQVVGKAGSVVFFNSNVWHKAGENKTDKSRMALTPVFCKPFYKPQFDYTQLCDEASSPWFKQIFGYNSRIPKTFNEWYSRNRFYKSDQL